MQIFLITIIGFLLRLIHINKPEGLWNDEYVSWITAATPFKDGFWNAVIAQCHMPLYYLYLKPFAGCSDLILRLTSVVPSVIAIPIMYLVGREYSKKIGYICAGITAILPFLVYYSQEVRFYSLVFMLSAVVLLALIKIIKGENRALILYVISSTILLLTHHLSIIYLFFMTMYILYKRKTIEKKFFIPLAVVIILIIPLGLNILHQIPSSQWWGKFSYTNLLFLFSDFLSPILTNNINAPAEFFYNKTLIFILLITLPTIIGIIGLLTGTKKAKGFVFITVAVILVMSILASTGTIVFITKYLIEILPLLILIIAFGFNNRIGTIVLSVFILFNLVSVLTPYYPAKIPRSEGHKLVGDVLNKRNPDYVLFTYYAPDRFYKYWNNPRGAYSISKINRFDYVETPQSILPEIKKGNTVSFIFLDSVSFIPEQALKQAKDNNVPEMFITFSDIKNKLVKYINDNYEDYSVDRKGSWTIITAIKK